jgi:hypothetical protein
MSISHLKNCIVAYEGGGYDGCMCEWNYAYFDKEGKFADIYSSGIAGCKTYSVFKYKVTQMDMQYDVYFIGNKKDMITFANHESVVNVLRVAAWFRNNNIDVVFEFTCKCGKTQKITKRTTGVGLHGIGGIRMDYTDFRCSSCKNNDK